MPEIEIIQQKNNPCGITAMGVIYAHLQGEYIYPETSIKTCEIANIPIFSVKRACWKYNVCNRSPRDQDRLVLPPLGRIYTMSPVPAINHFNLVKMRLNYNNKSVINMTLQGSRNNMSIMVNAQRVMHRSGCDVAIIGLLLAADNTSCIDLVAMWLGCLFTVISPVGPYFSLLCKRYAVGRR